MLNLTSAALKVFLALDSCDMRKSFNGLHTLASDQLHAATGAVRLTLVLFADEIITGHNVSPIAQLLPLNLDTFVPRGSTALPDAIVHTIDGLGQRFANSPANQVPGHVSRHPHR